MYQIRNKELIILELYLGDYNKSLYLREINKNSKIPLKTVQRILESLETNKILKSRLQGKNKYFSLNLENVETKYKLLQAEIHRTFKFIENYEFFKTFIKEIKSIQTPIIIFGSFAQFSADKDSDLDILIISDKKITLPYYLLPKNIHEIYLNEKKFGEALNNEEIFIKKIEQNHVILNNHSFFVNLMWCKYAK